MPAIHDMVVPFVDRTDPEATPVIVGIIPEPVPGVTTKFAAVAPGSGIVSVVD